MREAQNVRVTVTLSAEQAALARWVVDTGGAESVSAYVNEAVHRRLDRDRALAALGDLYARRGVTLRPEHHAWARRALGLGQAGDGAADGWPAGANRPAERQPEDRHDRYDADRPGPAARDVAAT
jgi:hypothetical protein